MSSKDYENYETKLQEVFSLLNPPEIKHVEVLKEEPCFYWQGFFVNYEDLIAEHSMLLDFRIKVIDKIKIYDKIVKMFKI